MTEFRTFMERLDETEAKLAALEALTGESELGSSTSSSGSGGSFGGSAPPMLPARAAPESEAGLMALAKEAPALEGVQELLASELAQGMAKFQQRCVHVDPITNQTLYGDSMKKKVSEAYKRYTGLTARANALRPAMDTAGKAEAARRAAAEEQARRDEEERARALAAQKAAERWQQEEAIAEEEKRRAEEEQEHEALGEAAATAREVRRREEEARKQAVEQEKARLRAEDASLLTSVNPGVPGVDKALAALLEACGGDRKAYRDSVGALALYVANVLSHPEEAAYKRIREANPLFKAKVGNFPGGVEALVAAGFTPQREDTAPQPAAEGGAAEEAAAPAPPLLPGQVAQAYQRVFVMHEPEVTSSEWTAWYDRVKAVRDRLQEEATRRG